MGFLSAKTRELFNQIFGLQQPTVSGAFLAPIQVNEQVAARIRRELNRTNPSVKEIRKILAAADKSLVNMKRLEMCDTDRIAPWNLREFISRKLENSDLTPQVVSERFGPSIFSL